LALCSKDKKFIKKKPPPVQERFVNPEEKNYNLMII